MWKKILVPAALVGLIAVFAIGLTLDPRAVPSPLVHQEAPMFSMTTFEGEPFTLADHRGKIVVLNFWASWCYPACYEEAPVLEATWQAFRDNEVVVVGVDIQDTEKAARAFIDQFKLTFPNGRDITGKISIDYGIYGVPETFIIDRQGKIVFKRAGAVQWETLVKALEPLLRG
ncbi:MAG: TlpA family protein disulfide reductase [Nitrospinae bacterium]|nr:TlpA family protein disulfide reductase [Nitrospinota bacterium]